MHDRCQLGGLSLQLSLRLFLLKDPNMNKEAGFGKEACFLVVGLTY